LATCIRSWEKGSSNAILDDSESAFFDSVNAEQIALAGGEVNFYGQNVKESKVDPLYGEFSQRKVEGPWRVHAWIQWPIINPEAGETGFGFDVDGMCVISRSELERVGAPYPFEGDIIEAFRTPYHDAESLGKGLFFDIIKAANDGAINDSPTFLQFKLTLKRRTQYGAERRLEAGE
jgi:hypothetical protein